MVCLAETSLSISGYYMITLHLETFIVIAFTFQGMASSSCIGLWLGLFSSSAPNPHLA